MKPLWDIKEFSRVTNLPEPSKRGKIYRKELPHIKLGRRIFFDPDEIMPFIDSCRVPAREKDKNNSG